MTTKESSFSQKMKSMAFEGRPFLLCEVSFLPIPPTLVCINYQQHQSCFRISALSSTVGSSESTEQHIVGRACCSALLACLPMLQGSQWSRRLYIVQSAKELYASGWSR